MTAVVIVGAHHNDLLDVKGPDRNLAHMTDFFSPRLGAPRDR